MSTAAFALFALLATGTDDAFTMNTFKCEPGGWRITTPAGWVLTQRPSEDPRVLVEVNATKSGTKGNIVIGWHKGSTLSSLKAKYDEQLKTPGTKAVKKPALSADRLKLEMTVDYSGMQGRTYAVDVLGKNGSVVELTIPGVGPAADYADLKAAVDVFADLLVFEAPGEKPWAHRKNIEHLKGKLCSSKTASLTFDGAGHLLVEPGHAATYYDLIGDDAKVAIPAKNGGATGTLEIACVAKERTADGTVTELLCGKTSWTPALCAP